MGKEDELVLAVRRNIVIPNSWNGIKSEGVGGFEQLIRNNSYFLRRGDCENDPGWKQIIPYLIFKHGNRFFVMQRSGQGGDDRIYNLYSLGIGGHIGKKDMKESSILNWAKREFKEEVDYRGSFRSQPLGLINDDSNEIGRVHLGYVILLDGDSDKIQIRDEHQSGTLQTIKDMEKIRPNMETWSQIVFDLLKIK